MSDDVQVNESEQLWLSQSRINAYLECGLYFYNTYIAKVPVETKGNYHTALGNGIHKCLEMMYATQEYDLDFLYEWWYRVCYEGYTEKNGQEVLPLLEDPEYEYKNEEEPKILYYHGKKLLREYFFKNRHEYGLNEVVATELNFKVPVGKDQSIVLNGYIDRIDRKPNGKLVVIDYKTGKEKKPEEVEWDIQLTLYALAIRKLFNEVEDELYLHFIKSNNKVRVKRSKAHFDDLLSKIKRVKEGIQARRFEPTPGNMCRYCPYDCPLNANASFRK